MAALTDTELGAIVSRQIEQAKAHDRSSRDAPRSKAIDYYLGNMDQYVPPEANRSKVVSRDVADTIGVVLPGIMRVFTASDKMAVAEPVGVEDVLWAREATDGINYVFWKDNAGYEVVYNATWDSLLTGNGIVKVFFDDEPVYSITFHTGLTEDQLALLLQPNEEGEAPEVLQQESETVVANGPDGRPVETSIFDVKIRTKVRDGSFVVEAIPPEEFLISKDAVRTGDAAFTAHWQRKMRSELIAMGYDKAKVWAIPSSVKSATAEAAARDINTPGEESPDKSTELVDYFECYVRIDADDDGEAELVRSCQAGSQGETLLDWEVWEDEHPFDDIPCEPIPHRWDARSLADETMDIQDVKTVLMRQGLNNTYWVNNPQRFAVGSIKNPELLDNPTFGSTVWGGPNSSVATLPVPYIADKALLMMQHMDEVRQARTGVGRQSMALDPEALQNQTAEAARNQRDAAYSQTELLARNMAEWGWRKVFRKLLKLMIKHPQQRMLMMNGKPVQIDPRPWNADMDVTINVGLGTGSRDRDMLMLRNVLDSQLMLADRFMTAGAVNDAVDMLPKIIQTMTKIAESAGIRNPEEFYPDYTDDKVMKLKQLAQSASARPDPKVQADIARAEADHKLAVSKAQSDAQLQASRQQSDMDLRRYQIDSELQLKREQLAAELQLKRELAIMEMQYRATMPGAGFASSDVRVGGQPG